MAVLNQVNKIIKPATAFKMRIIRRYLKWISTVVIFSCCYVMLFKSSSKQKDSISAVPEQRLVIKTNVLNQNLNEENIQTAFSEATTKLQVKPEATEGLNELQNKIFHLPKVAAPSSDPNKTLNWLDLWSNDTFCNQFFVHLHDENSIKPRALVSFPGSGNTWLRMLLMGLTGMYVDTIYPNDEFFHSKGTLA